MSKPIFSMESFTEFLGSRDPNETYYYQDVRNCAVCQYLKEKGFQFNRVYPTCIELTPPPEGRLTRHEDLMKIDSCFDEVVAVPYEGPHGIFVGTFGEAHKRALEWLKEHVDA